MWSIFKCFPSNYLIYACNWINSSNRILIAMVFKEPLVFSPDSLEIICPQPDVPNGKIISGFRSIYRYKDSIMFNCKDGFDLTGSSLIQCENDSSWNPSLPVCKPSEYGSWRDFNVWHLGVPRTAGVGIFACLDPLWMPGSTLNANKIHT